ncbi:unnamed protein product [Urochloa decumbens]|uniref:Uncharacterized protein n=1 Tax=Urochloa decumbens TaxID=240449 RepID=A0ABC9EUE8_9POAL
MEDRSLLVYSFLEAKAGKAWHGTNRGKITLESLTKRAVSHMLAPASSVRDQRHCVSTRRSPSECSYGFAGAT